MSHSWYWFGGQPNTTKYSLHCLHHVAWMSLILSWIFFDNVCQLSANLSSCLMSHPGLAHTSPSIADRPCPSLIPSSPTLALMQQDPLGVEYQFLDPRFWSLGSKNHTFPQRSYTNSFLLYIKESPGRWHRLTYKEHMFPSHTLCILKSVSPYLSLSFVITLDCTKTSYSFDFRQTSYICFFYVQCILVRLQRTDFLLQVIYVFRCKMWMFFIPR